MMNTLTIDINRPTKRLGDLFGLFFEDLNHAADGGLYAELVQNRSFEFAPVDHSDYHPLTAWEQAGDAVLTIHTEAPAFSQNPHYLRLAARQPFSGVRNTGYGAGIPIRQGGRYRFGCYVRSAKRQTLQIRLENADRRVYARAELSVCGAWQKYEAELAPGSSAADGRLAILLTEAGEIDLDFVSLFPKATFKNRPNGLRADIAGALADMKPRFLRFPGGCLIHDGTLCAADRDCMYRWKNTIGPVEHRPARRNSWQYNQTFGLGFYEYFLFCEDIGAKPLPVVSGGCDPHHRRFAPLEQMQEWIGDALDLIGFANGSPDTVWGGMRASMGHPAPFHLEYIAIGNEEVHPEFYERLPLFVHAIRAKYPEVKIIGSSGPFAAGGEFERGWRSATETRVDLVDEHYYQAPEWFLAHTDRYTAYPADGPKVFLGEYASWGNTFANALAEAAFMTHLQNAPAVALACYAPMLCHTAYVNWRPDMLYFDGSRVLRTANYHVQSLFMRHQGDVLLHTESQGLVNVKPLPDPPVQGAVFIGANDTRIALHDIRLTADGQTRTCPDTILCGRKRLLLAEHCAAPLTLTFSVRRLEGAKGLCVYFGEDGPDNGFVWGVGGWENQDCILEKKVNGRNICLTQSGFSLQDGRDYTLRLEIRRRTIRTYINGTLYNQADDKLPAPDALYHTVSRDEATGDVILKAVNVTEKPVRVEIELKGMTGSLHGLAETLAGYAPQAENTFDHPDRIRPALRPFRCSGPQFPYTFPARSVTAIRLSPA